MARNKYVTTQVDEEVWQSIIDAANLWGESISKATYKLVQRGIISLDKDLGSKTPDHIRVSRITQNLNTKMTTKQRVTEGYRLAKELGDVEAAGELEAVAKRLNIELPNLT